jgi:ABC-type sugar transport system ATPase subunit
MHQRNCERVENHWLVSLAQLLKELPEVFALCDRLTVLRDGRHVRTMSVKETTEAEAVRRMVGRESAAESSVSTHFNESRRSPMFFGPTSGKTGKG